MHAMLRVPIYTEHLDRDRRAYARPVRPVLRGPRAEPDGRAEKDKTERRDRRTGFEPFLLAAVIGLGVWALLLSPFLF